MSRIACVILGVCGLAISTSTARAQDALGDGRALDANLQVGSGGVNRKTRDFAAELRFRNAIVTGNAPAGLSFRGDAGYSDVGEFLGDLGSNDLYAFRRDSLYSGLAGQGIRGLDALQMQFALTTGGRPSGELMGPLAVSRSGSGARASAVRDPAAAASEGLARLPDSSPNADARGQGLWSLRSASAYESTRGLAPGLLDVRTDGTTYVGIAASPLTGITSVPFDPVDVERASRTPAKINPNRVDTAVPSAIDYSTAGQDTYAELMRRLAETASAPAPEAADGAAAEVPDWRQRLDALRSELSAEPSEPGAEAGADSPETPPPSFDPRTLSILRRAGVIDSLSSPTAAASPYTDHMGQGQRALGAGRYFDGEERFTRALASRPDDTMASVGRIHSQIGAGLYLSASVNLRALLADHPEVIGARYDAGLLPSPDRSARIIEQLKQSVDRPGGLPRESALVLAYLGYQVGDQAAIKAGLDALDASTPAGEKAARGLLELARGVWLPEDQPGR